MIKYLVVGRKKPGSADGPIIFYPKIAPVTVMDLDQAASQIERECTVSKPDILAVLNAMQHVVLQALKNGQSVRMGDIGSFRPTLHAKSEDALDKVTAEKNILSVRCRYTPSGYLVRQLQKRNLKFASLTNTKSSGSGDAGDGNA